LKNVLLEQIPGRRHSHIVRFALFFALVLFLFSTPVRAETHDAEHALKQKLVQWLEQGWSHKAGDPPFDFQSKVGFFYSRSPSDVILFDELDPNKTVHRSAESHGAVWGKMLGGTNFTTSVIDGPHLVLSGDLAAATVIYRVNIQAADGVQTADVIGNFVLRKGAEGWKIIREHGSALPPQKAK